MTYKYTEGKLTPIKAAPAKELRAQKHPIQHAHMLRLARATAMLHDIVKLRQKDLHHPRIATLLAALARHDDFPAIAAAARRRADTHQRAAESELQIVYECAMIERELTK